MNWKLAMDRSRISTDKPLNRKERRKEKKRETFSQVVDEVLNMARIRTPEEESKLEEIRERETKRLQSISTNVPT